jgi:hypothetical protein
MKKVILILPFLLLIGLGFLLAQDTKYEQVMRENLQSIGQAKSVADWQNIANKFERIATMKPQEWLPNYWAGFCYTIMSFDEPERIKKDQYADQAEKFWQNIQSQNIDNDEVMVLKAFIAQAKLSADPMSRWQSQGPIFQEYLTKAQSANPENPRVYLLQGQNTYYTPEAFGGGKNNALPLLKKAQEKFATYKSPSSIHPNWGENNLKTLLATYEVSKN